MKHDKPQDDDIEFVGNTTGQDLRSIAVVIGLVAALAALALLLRGCSLGEALQLIYTI